MTPPIGNGQLASVVLTEPQTNFKVGQKLVFQDILFPPLPSAGLYAFEDLAHFKGALLILVSINGAERNTFGSAILVKPGLAICASHVIQEHLRLGHFDGDRAAFYAFGPTETAMHAWQVDSITYSLTGDVALLTMLYAAEMPAELTIHYFATSAKLPVVGDRVTAAGFRPTAMIRDKLDSHGTVGAFLGSSGKVSDVWQAGRDHMLPRPCFAAHLTTVGSMSGGPVLDSAGRVIGIVSSSVDTFEEFPAVTFVTLIWDALFMEIEPKWPGGKFWPERPTRVSALLATHDAWRLWIAPNSSEYRYQISGDTPDPLLQAP